jgi:hypothetical protein
MTCLTESEGCTAYIQLSTVRAVNRHVHSSHRQVLTSCNSIARNRHRNSCVYIVSTGACAVPQVYQCPAAWQRFCGASGTGCKGSRPFYYLTLIFGYQIGVVEIMRCVSNRPSSPAHWYCSTRLIPKPSSVSECIETCVYSPYSIIFY